MFDPDDVSEGGEDSDAEPEVVAPAAPREALFQVTRIVLSRTQFVTSMTLFNSNFPGDCRV